jgi:hypothetical protein
VTRCDRCGCSPAPYDWWTKDEETGEKAPKKICWDCDFDLTNGHEWGDEDAGEIMTRRAEEDYEYDPLYYPKPSWYP